MLFGHIVDKLPSRRALYVSGLLIVFFSTLFFALATSLWSLLTARLLEGFSTAIVTTVGYTLLTDIVGPDQLGKAMGYTSMALSLALMLGPVLGGLLYEYCGYFWVFAPVLVLIAIEVGLRLMVVDKKTPILSASHSRSSSPGPRDPLSNGHPTKNAFLDDASAETHHLLNPESKPDRSPANAYAALLASPRFIVVLIGLFTLNSIACGFDSVLTPYLRETFHMNAAQAAGLFLTLAVPMLLAPLLGSLTDRYGPKLPTAAGLALAVPSLGLLSLVSRRAHWAIVELAVMLAFLGLALALAMPPLRVEANLVIQKMERERPGMFGPNGAYGRAYGMVNIVVATAGLVGPLYAGFLRVAAGWNVLAWCNAVLSVGLLVLVSLVTSSKPKKEKHIEETIV